MNTNPSSAAPVAEAAASSVTLKRKLKSHLECPVCSETYVPPIFMCRNGHSVCAKCQPKLNECSTCRSPGMPTLRCLQLEKITDLVEFPCRNTIHGCKLMFDRDGMAEHLPECEHGFVCQICEVWKGPAADISGHILNAHGVCGWTLYPAIYLKNTFDTSTFSERNFRTNNNLVKFCALSSCDALFWLNVKNIKNQGLISCTMRLVSHNPTEASKFSFVLGFPSRDGKLRVTYQGQVLNLKENASLNKTMFLVPADIFDSYGNGPVSLTLSIMEEGVATGDDFWSVKEEPKTK